MRRARRRANAALGVALLTATCATVAGRRAGGGRRGLERTMSYPQCAMQRWTVPGDVDTYFWNELKRDELTEDERRRRNLEVADWTGNMTETVLETLASAGDTIRAPLDQLIKEFKQIQEEGIKFNPKQYWEEQVMPLLVESVGRDDLAGIDESYYLYYEENDDEGWIMKFFEQGIAELEGNWKNINPEMFVQGRNALEGPSLPRSRDLEIVEKMKQVSEQVKESWQKGIFEIGQDSPIFFNSVPGRGLVESEWNKIIGTTSPDNEWLSETKSSLLDYLMPYQAEAEAWFDDPILEKWGNDPLAPLLQHTMQLASEDIIHNNNTMHAHDVLPDGTDLDWYVLLPEDPTERQEAVQEIAKELPEVLKNMGMRWGGAGLPAESLEAAGNKFLSMLQILDTPGASKFETPPSSVNRNRRLLEEGPTALQSLFRTEPFTKFLAALNDLLSEADAQDQDSAPEESDEVFLDAQSMEDSHARKLLGARTVHHPQLREFVKKVLEDLNNAVPDRKAWSGEKVRDFLSQFADKVAEKVPDLGTEDGSFNGRKLLSQDFKIYHALVSAAKALQPLDEADTLNSDSIAGLAKSFLDSFDLGIQSDVQLDETGAPMADPDEESTSDRENLMRDLLQIEEIQQDGSENARPSLAGFMEDVLGTFEGILDDATALLESISGTVAPAAEELDSFMGDLREDLISSGSRRLLEEDDQKLDHLQRVIDRLKGARQTFSERLARGHSSKVSLEELANMTKSELTRIVSLANDALVDAAAFLQSTLEIDQSEAPEAAVDDLEEDLGVAGRRKLLDINDLLASTNLLDMALSGSIPFDGSMLDELGMLTDLPIDGNIIKELERSGLVTPQQLEDGVHSIEELIAGAMKQAEQVDPAAEASGLDETVVDAINSMVSRAPAPAIETVEEDMAGDAEASAVPPPDNEDRRASIFSSSPARTPLAAASLQKKSNLLDRIIAAIGLDRVKEFVQGCRSLKMSCAPQLNRIEGEIEQFGDVLNPLLTTYETWTFLQSQAKALAERMNDDGLLPDQDDISRISKDIQEGRFPGFPSINLGQAVRDRIARWQDTLESIMKSRTEQRRPMLDLAQGFFAESPEEPDVAEIRSLGTDGNSTGLGTILEVMSSLSNAQKTAQKIAQAPTFFINGALSDKDEQALHRSAPWLQGPDWDSHTKILGRANSFGYFFGFLDGYKVRDHPAVASIVLARKIYAHLKASVDDVTAEQVLQKDRERAWDGLLKLRFAAEDLASKFFKPLEEPPEWMKLLGRPSWEINNELKKLVESNAYLQGWVEGFMFRDDPAVDLVVTAIKIAKRNVFVYNDESWDKNIRIDFGKVKFGKHSAGMAEAPSVKEMLEALKFRLEQRPLLKRSGIAFPSEILEAFDLPPTAEEMGE